MNNSKYFLLFILFFFISLCGCSEEDDFLIIGRNESNYLHIPRSNLDNRGSLLFISHYMNSPSSGSVQGAACHGDLVFQFQDKNSAVFIYDMKLKALIEEVSLAPDNNNHCNNASFSTLYFSPSDDFPLLYVGGSSIGGYNNIQVYRILNKDNHYSFSKIQEIVLPQATSDNDLYWTGVIMDDRDPFLYIYSNGYNEAKITKFKIPDIYISSIKLVMDDILEQFQIAKFTHQQGACMRNGKLFVFDGVPDWGDTNFLRIIDVNKRRDSHIIDLTTIGFTYEAEGGFFWNNNLYCITNSSKGIYKFCGRIIDN